MTRPTTIAAERRHSAAFSAAKPRTRAPGIWLLALAFMVLGQVLLGGITRLSESGLSIMEWAPIMGALPPLSEAEWSRIFEIYRQTGEYRLANSDLDLAGFKAIFWWEYIHRLWGRGLALAFVLPFAWFWARGGLTPYWRWRLAAIFALGALQGLMGWVMVESGFSDRADVSQYRLVLHLLLALLIFGALLWSALSMAWPAPRPTDPAQVGALRRHGWVLVSLLAVEIGLGGLVAGLDAGLIYNSFPLMGSDWVPAEIGFVDPLWRDPFENAATAQFLHRMMALMVMVVGLLLCLRLWRQPEALGAGGVRSASILVLLLLGQAGLGILTLLLLVPPPVALAHQAGAFLLFGMALFLVHRQSGRQ